MQLLPDRGMSTCVCATRSDVNFPPTLRSAHEERASCHSPQRENATLNRRIPARASRGHDRYFVSTKTRSAQHASPAPLTSREWRHDCTETHSERASALLVMPDPLRSLTRRNNINKQLSRVSLTATFTNTVLEWNNLTPNI